MQYDLRNYVVWAQEFKIQRCVESALVSYIIVFTDFMCFILTKSHTITVGTQPILYKVFDH